MHFYPIVIVEAGSSVEARACARSWVNGLFEDGNADTADYGGIAEGAPKEIVARAGSPLFRRWIREASSAERELAKEYWLHLKELALAFAKRDEPPSPEEKYVVDGSEQTADLGLWHGRKLHDLLEHQRNQDVFTTLGRIYDQREKKETHVFDLPTSAGVFAVRCDFHL